MSEYEQFTDEDSCPGSPSSLRQQAVCSSDCPPPYFPPTDEGNALYTWGDNTSSGSNVASSLPKDDGPKPPPYSHVANDVAPSFDLQGTESGHPNNNISVPSYTATDTSVVIQQPSSIELPSVVIIFISPPNDYLGWSICGCLCCVWSIGICAIISSYDSRRAASNGDMTNAKASSVCALRLNIINMIFGVVIITYCLLRFGLGF
ncbi:uncharacterized protein LOC132549439 [Ylistrum balloti]|uniref:uncharacterized protein LOC132549439 n=1 Tax=Ylistrum balloti TaxID=509963 RepID=UPI002905EA88|nr:uncharacterized protein LOC132549439 [Ylistrum balloti]